MQLQTISQLMTKCASEIRLFTVQVKELLATDEQKLQLALSWLDATQGTLDVLAKEVK